MPEAEPNAIDLALAEPAALAFGFWRVVFRGRGWSARAETGTAPRKSICHGARPPKRVGSLRFAVGRLLGAYLSRGTKQEQVAAWGAILRSPTYGPLKGVPPVPTLTGIFARRNCKKKPGESVNAGAAMTYAARQPLYRDIEKDRGSKVIAFVTGERPGLETQIASDAIEPFIALLDQIGPTKKISLVLETNGGQTSAAWRLINLIRSFGDAVEVVVPNKAMSAGTLISLGSDEIVMTKQAALGPIDPSLSQHPLAPTIANSTGQSFRLPVSAEAVRGYIEEVKKDVKDAAALATVWTNLSGQIHPIVLGEIFRLGGQIRSMAQHLIKNQVKDDKKAEKIIQMLCSDSGSHDYTINRRQALDMGLNVAKPSQDLYGKLNALTQSFKTELKTFEPYSSLAMLAGQPQVGYKLIRGLIESTEGGCFGFVSEGTFSAQQNGTVADQRAFEGWRKLP